MSKIAIAMFTVVWVQTTAVRLCCGQEASAERESAYGVNVEMGIASAYNRRGENAFQSASQHDQAGVVSPRVRWSIFDTGLYLRYAGHYQAWGDNQTYLVDMGRGHEQDLGLGWERPFTPWLRLELAFDYIFYPFASAETIGTENPSYLEPRAGVSFTPRQLLELRFEVSYYCGVQDVLEERRYVYFHPSIYKRFDLSRTFDFDGGLGFGYKLFTSFPERSDSAFDVDFFLGVPIDLTPELYVEPAVHLTWMLISMSRWGDQYYAWFALNFGINL